MEQEKNMHTPIVCITANAMDTDSSEAIESGMDEYMTKPFDLLFFKELLDKLGLKY